jgi:NAD(P)H-hydrate epimerase
VIPLLSRSAVRDLDRDALHDSGSIAVADGNAGRGAFDALLELAADRLDRVLIVSGNGQNGGDGWVVARHLTAAGFSPRVALVGAPTHRRRCAVNWLALRWMGVGGWRGSQAGLAWAPRELGAELVVNALFGTDIAGR